MMNAPATGPDYGPERENAKAIYDAFMDIVRSQPESMRISDVLLAAFGVLHAVISGSHSRECARRMTTEVKRGFEMMLEAADSWVYPDDNVTGLQ
jgi:hypothetical protein